MKNISVSRVVWNRIRKIKNSENFKHLSNAVEFLLDHYDKSKSFPEEKTNVSEHEKTLKDLNIDEQTQHRIYKLQEDHNLDNFPGLLNHLLDCHTILQRESLHKPQEPDRNEKPLRNLEETTVLDEIYNHIQQLKPSRKLEEESVVDAPPTVDIASQISEGQDHIDDTTEKQEFISCPVCWNIVPLVVKLDQDGNPLKKHEDGIEYKMVDGVLQRRFSGPDDNYLPFQIQTGGKVIVEESMAVSTLRRLDKKLFDDFTDVLKAVTFKFVGGWW